MSKRVAFDRTPTLPSRGREDKAAALARFGWEQLMSTFRPIADIGPTQQSAAMTKTGYDALMHEACVTWGFCGCIKQDQRLHVDLFIPPEGPVTADQFVDWLFLADNINPSHEAQRWQPQKDALRAAFVKHMGAETVDARSLRWSDVTTSDEQTDVKFRGRTTDA